MTSAVLLLDIGNSRAKWALAQGREWLAEGVAAHGEIDRLLQEWDRFSPPAKVMACNVAGTERAHVFSAYWQSRQVPMQWLQSSEKAAGVHNLYEPVGHLGSDRWAALIAAWARTHGACLVVSAGTAVTIDALSKKGEFLGGMILPGRQLMQNSLVTGTHALEKHAGEISDFPRNTASAMASGIATAVACAVSTGYRRLVETGIQPPPCIVTGGDAEWLASQLRFGVIIAPKLVLEGLLIMSQGGPRK